MAATSDEDTTPDLEHPEIGILVALAYRAMAERHQILMREHGIDSFRPAYGYIFRALHPDGATLKYLADLAQISKQAVTQIVDGLEELGLASRESNPEDRRYKIVQLTEKGKRTFDIAVQCWTEIEEEWAELVGQRKMAGFRSSLEAYVAEYGDWRSGERPKVRPVW